MIGKTIVWAFLLIAFLAEITEGSAVRGTQQCRVERFDLWVFDSDNSPQLEEFGDTALDLTDFPLGKLNIVAAVTDGCKPKCVKLSLAGSDKVERDLPFALYGDYRGMLNRGAPKQSGLQELKACLYLDRYCTIGEYGCNSKQVDIIPANEPLNAGPFTFKPFSVTFNGVDEGDVTIADTTFAAQTLCTVISAYWSFGAFYRQDVRVRNFQCVGVSIACTGALTIEFKTVASVEKLVEIFPYTNRRLPDSDELFEKMTTLLQNNNEIGPNAPGSRDYFVQLLGPDNPYSSVSSFNVMV
jgi:hypothetical protein